MDWFGIDVKITKLNDEESLIEVLVNEEAFFCWTMQYALHIEVVEPTDMRERISDAVKELNKKYNG